MHALHTVFGYFLYVLNVKFTFLYRSRVSGSLALLLHTVVNLSRRRRRRPFIFAIRNIRTISNLTRRRTLTGRL